MGTPKTRTEIMEIFNISPHSPLHRVSFCRTKALNKNTNLSFFVNKIRIWIGIFSFGRNFNCIWYDYKDICRYISLQSESADLPNLYAPLIYAIGALVSTWTNA